MSETADGATPSRAAWQPFTFGGLAAFAQAGVGRVLLAQLVAAILIGLSVACFLHRNWWPAVLQAIQQMPESARIAGGNLTGLDESVIAGTKFFAIAVTPEAASQIGQSADVQLQFRPTDFRVGSVFRPDWGWEFDYVPGTVLVLSRSKLEPWWGAWHPVFLTCAGLAVMVLMFLNWALLALIYTVPAKCLAWFADRQLSWGGAWKLSSAALLPGASLMVAGLLLYAWQAVDLIGLASFWLAHLLTGWVYLIGGACFCPRMDARSKKHNPFTS